MNRLAYYSRKYLNSAIPFCRNVTFPMKPLSVMPEHSMDRWELIQKLVLRKDRAFSACSQDRNNTDLFNKFQFLQVHLKTTTEESKQKHYSCLSDKVLESKTTVNLFK